MRGLRWCAPVGVVVLALVGCGGGSVPVPSSPVRVPVVWHTDAGPDAVFWADGLPDDGKWSGNEWVAAYREVLVLEAVAQYARDYSDPRLVALTQGTYEPIEDTRTWRDSGRELPYFPGPVPSVVLGVQGEGDGDSAVVSVCLAPGWVFSSVEEFEAYEFPFDWRRFEVTLHCEDGQIVLDEWKGQSDLDRACRRPEGVRVGLFEPAPPYGEEFDPLSVLGVDGEPFIYRYLGRHPETAQHLPELEPYLPGTVRPEDSPAPTAEPGAAA